MKFIRNILILFALLVALLFLRSCGALPSAVEPSPVSEEQRQEDERPQRMTVAIREVIDEPKEEQGNEGQFIAVSADYRKHLGFPGYVRHMKRLGGRFVLFNTTRQQIVAEVDPVAGSFTSIRKSLFQGMSPRSREVQKEIAVSRLLRKANDLYGEGRYSVLLLLPQSLDDRLQSSISRSLQSAGISPPDVMRVSGVYRSVGGLVLDITTAQLSDGQTTKCNFSIKL